MDKKSTISILYPWKWGRRAATLADVLSAFLVKWPQEFTANDVAGLINDNTFHNAREQLVREFLLPGAPTGYTFSADSIGRALKKHFDETVKGDDGRKKSYTYHVEVMPKVGR